MKKDLVQVSFIVILLTVNVTILPQTVNSKNFINNYQSTQDANFISSITINQINGSNTVNLKFGIESGTTDGYDSGIDIIRDLPMPGNLIGYFDENYGLKESYKPYASTKEWTLKVISPSNDFNGNVNLGSITISWIIPSTGSIPPNTSFKLLDADRIVLVNDMLTTNSISFTPQSASTSKTYYIDVAFSSVTNCYSLSTNVSPAGSGNILVNTSANCSANYSANTQISLTAEPSNGYTFSSWTGTGGSFSNISSSTTTFTITGNANITATFTQNPTISVSLPTSGTIWIVGDQGLVNWSATGSITNVNIKLSTDGGTTYIPLATNIVNDGSEQITVPNNPSATCKIKVESASDQNIYGISQGNFIIQQQTVNGQWISQSSGTSNYLQCVDFINNSVGWAVGWNGTILKTTNGGNTWLSQSSGTTQKLYSVKFISENIGWVVGWAGTILKTTNGGSSWQSQSSGTNEWLNSVGFVDNNTGWAVGYNGTILRTTNGGVNWLKQTSLQGIALRSIQFPVNSSVGWIAGESEVIMKTTDGGSNWFNQIVWVTNALWSIYFPNNNNVGWAAGANGTILKTTDGGTSWQNQSSPMANTIYSIYFLDQNNGWATGGPGVIIKTTNGGNNWIQENTGTLNGLNSIQFPVDNSAGWAVGEGGIILKYSTEVSNQYKVTTSSNPQNGGATFGDGTYTTGQNVTVTASANSGYSFSNWTENGTVVSTNSNYPFYMPAYDINLIANFQPAKVLTVLVPNGGESWIVGSSHNITWTSSGVTNVKIDYTANNGTSWNNIVSSTAASTGSYPWTIPIPPSTQCKVRISDASNSSVNDISDNVFTIFNNSNPSVITTSATNISNSSAQINGTVNPNGTNTSYFFEYGKTTGYDSTTSTKSAGNGNSPVPVSEILTGLLPGTTYHYWLIASNNNGVSYGNDSTFTTKTKKQFFLTVYKVSVDSAVTISVNNVNYILKDTSAFKAVYDSGSVVSVQITWGEGVNFMGWTGSIQASASILNVNMNSDISLTANFQYLPVRLLSVTSAGLGKGFIKVNGVTYTLPYAARYNLFRVVNLQSLPDSLSQFSGWTGDTTTSQNQIALTMYKSYSLNINYKLNPGLIRIVSPNGGENWIAGSIQKILWTSPLISRIKIDYSTNSGFNWFNIVSDLPAASGSYNWIVPNNPTSQAKIRITDISNINITDTSDAVFTISEPVPPALITIAASNITSNSAQLNGSINPNGLSSKYNFVYGKDTSYGFTTIHKDAGSGSSAFTVSESVSALQPNTTYHFRISASNSAGKAAGNDFTFTTKDTVFKMSVTQGGNGSGYVKINGNQFTLPVTQNFSSGTLVSLEAFPNPGFSFIGWRGDTVTSSNPINIKMISSKNIIAQFEVSFGQPVVSTDSARKIGDNTEVLYGTVNPNGLSTSYKFEYGIDTTYGFSTALKILGSGVVPFKVSDTVEGLSSNKQYHFRIAASNSAGANNGNDLTFMIIVVSVKDESNTVGGFYLSQNYPNPFNPSTVINYSVPSNSYVSIKIYNVLGNEVATLVNEEKNQGRYSAQLSSRKLSGNQLTSGVYFYRMTAVPLKGKGKTFVETKKLVLLR